jgi:hypothetical protein
MRTENVITDSAKISVHGPFSPVRGGEGGRRPDEGASCASGPLTLTPLPR